MARHDHPTSVGSLASTSQREERLPTGLEVAKIENELPIEAWYQILSFLPWDKVSEVRLVSHFWYALCADIRRDVGYHAARCLYESDAQSPHALWAYLLESQGASFPDGKSTANTYLRVNFPTSRFRIDALSSRYQEEEGGIFNSAYSIRDRILEPNYIGRNPLKGLSNVQKKKAEGHVMALFKKWQAQLPPGQLLKRADELAQQGAALKAQYPQAIALLGQSKEGRVLPEKLDMDEASAYRKLQCFLEESAAYEEVLLEFAAFANMATNVPSGPNYRRGVADLFILTPEFPLLHRLSKVFYFHYMPFIFLKISINQDPYTLSLSSAKLMQHLYADDDALLLNSMEHLWGLSDVLEANPTLYQRMSPDLWVQWSKGIRSIPSNILKDPRICSTFNSQQLLMLVSEPGSISLLVGLYTQTPDLALINILQRIDSRHLCQLRYDLRIKNGTEIYEFIHTILCEKFKVMETEELKDLQADFPEPSWAASDETVKKSLSEELAPRLLEEKKRAEKRALERRERLRSMLGSYPLPVKTSDRSQPSTLLSGSVFASSSSAPTLSSQMETLAKEFHHFRLEGTASRYSGCSAPLIRWFKSKKTNASRQQQLQLLRYYSKESDVAVKVGALVKISKEIASETNVFRSSMKSLVDAMISSHLNRTLGRMSSPAFNQEKAKCLAAFEKHDANRHLPHIEYTF